MEYLRELLFWYCGLLTQYWKLNISSLLESSGLSLVWDKNDHRPRDAPCGDPPGRSLRPDLTPCHLTVIFLPSKKLMRRGMRLGLTPLSWKDFTARGASWQSNALEKSWRVTRAAAVCCRIIVLLKRSVGIRLKDRLICYVNFCDEIRT